MYLQRNYCRACGYANVGYPGTKARTNEKLVPVLDLGLQPLANDFQKEGKKVHGYYPLKVLLCPQCKLAQLSAIVDPATLYSNYAYVTSHSKSMLAHFDTLRTDILAEFTEAKSVLEIGSNDGTLLAFLKNNPFETVLGCDPAENLAAIANSKGIPTICDMFTENNCDCQKQKDVVIARHVMCHIDDWNDFIRGLERVTHQESLVFIEVPYYKDMIKRRSWDQVYAEHLSYMSIGAMAALVGRLQFGKSHFHIHSIKHYDIHGGSIGIMLRRNDSKATPASDIQDWIKTEDDALKEWKELSEAKDLMVQSLKALVSDLRQKGKSVCGYGASAKSTVWMNACGFQSNDISYICDSTPQKQTTFSPGSNVPVVCEGMLTADMPDYAVCFAWNYFSSDIYDKEVCFRKNGGKWILPVPVVEVV